MRIHTQTRLYVDIDLVLFLDIDITYVHKDTYRYIHICTHVVDGTYRRATRQIDPAC